MTYETLIEQLAEHIERTAEAESHNRVGNARVVLEMLEKVKSDVLNEMPDEYGLLEGDQ